MKKLLVDESGYVLVLRKPRFFVATEALKEELSEALSAPPARTVGSIIETPSCSVPHCCFYCAWCGHPLLLPNDRIGSPFGNPDTRKIDARSIATVCLNCKHIGNYSMFRACRGFDTRHKIVNSLSSGKTLLLNWLHCDAKTCLARVPFFVKIEDGAEEVRTEDWFWDELTCASGHRIRPVPLDPTMQLPLRS